MIEKALGRELPTTSEIRQRQKLERQTPQQVDNTKDAALIDALPQTSPESSVMSLNPSDGMDEIEDSTPPEETVEELKKSHSPSPQHDEQNREHLIRRAALGDKPTQEEMDAVAANGLEQHRINFSYLY